MKVQDIKSSLISVSRKLCKNKMPVYAGVEAQVNVNLIMPFEWKFTIAYFLI